MTFVVGLATLRFDPMPFAFLALAGSPGIQTLSSAVMVVLVLATVAAALATTPPVQRPRAAWLLLPLPAGLLAADVCLQL